MNPDIREVIESHTSAELTSFLDELANGTRNYRTIHSLTEQIEHQYHGRFLIELLQNAHDSLRAAESRRSRRWIHIHFDSNASEYGVLYVANDGRPFLREDFVSLARLGQSAKDPNQFVGNKGIGFRSVLEICESPEVFSAGDKDLTGFRGFCFAFRPSFVREFRNTLLQTWDTQSPPSIDFNGVQRPLVNGWTRARLESFWMRWSSRGKQDLAEEIQFLSPYLLPVPNDNYDDRVAEFGSCGFATVVKLPLRSLDAKNLVETQLADFDIEDMLFLDSVDEIEIKIDSKRSCHKRHSTSWRIPNDWDWEEVRLESQSDICHEFADASPSAGPAAGIIPEIRYWVWSKHIGGRTDSTKSVQLEAAAKNLPGRWSELREATVSLGVRLGPMPAKGRFSIFLPTEQETGFGAHINAPFYGEMNRTDIPFTQPLNKFLLERAAELAIDVCRALADLGEDGATARVDLVGPTSDPGKLVYWQALNAAGKVPGKEIANEPILLTSRGWKSLSNCAPLPTLNEAQFFTRHMLREVAAYPVLAECLESRTDAISKLVWYETQRDFKPTSEQLASTIEQGAEYILHKGQSTAERWEQFWLEARRLVPAFSNRPHPLLGKRVVFSNGLLLARSFEPEEHVLFTLPLEEEGEEGELRITDVPSSLTKRIGFLDPQVPTRKTDASGHRIKSSIRDYLLQGNPSLIDEFRRRSIFVKLLIPLVENGPVLLGSDRATLCRDVLFWAIRLVESARGTETLVGLLADLRVPCRGGWHRIRDVSFGPGWLDEKEDPGILLETVLQAAGGEAESRLLLPPSHPEWGTDAREIRQTLVDAGVTVGLRLRGIETGKWKSSFEMSLTTLPRFPRIPPSGMDSNLWANYAESIVSAIERRYSGSYSYNITGICFPDGFASWTSLSPTAKSALTKAILHSFATWNLVAWQNCTVEKQTGEAHSQKVKSPLRYALESLPWICFERDGKYVSFMPSQLILIPSAQLEWGRHRFDHLDYLSMDLVRLVDSHPGTSDLLQQLGIAAYPAETKSADVRFLEVIAAAVASNRFNPTNRDVVLGQLYAAWGVLEPFQSGALPKSLVVSRGRLLDVVATNGNSAFYLPDEDRGAVELLKREGHAVVEIRVGDAKRLKHHFELLFGTSVRPLSRFKVTPLVAGSVWQPTGDESFLSSSELGWIPVVALAVAAYAGNSAFGTHAKSFVEAAKRLRRAKVAFKEAISLRADWESEVLFEHPVAAVWISDSETLVIDKSTEAWLETLAEPLEEILDRGDLDGRLQLVFTKLNATDPPTPEQILRALQVVRINADQFSDVEKAWLGDFSWVLQRLLPAIKLLISDFEVSRLANIRTEHELRSILNSQCFSEAVSIDELFSIARGSRSDEDVGRELFARIGSSAQLSNWNKVLVKLGVSYRRVRNMEVQDQFTEHLNAIRTCVHSVFRKVARDRNQPQLYVRLRDEFDQIQLPEDIEFLVWRVEFSMVAACVHALLTRNGVDQTVENAVLHARDPEDLVGRLGELGLEPGIDPAQLFAANLSLSQKALEILLRAGLVLSERQNVLTDSWTEPIALKFEDVKQDLQSGIGYVDSFSEKTAIAHALKFIPQDGVGAQIRAAAVLVERIDDILKGLGLDREDLHNADFAITRGQEEERRRRRQIIVCGQNFDGDESNLENLFNHISEQLPGEHMSQIDISNPASLEKIPAKKPTVSGGGGPGGQRNRERLSATERNVVGLAGEIHVWRSLKQKLGGGMTAKCWVSENRKYVFADSPGEDSLGYDFEVPIEGIVYRIEVKATRGELSEFELGPSEVRCAVRTVGRKKERYVIIHVLKALSLEPKLIVVPNPFDGQYSQKFRFHESSAFSVSYRHGTVTETHI